VTPASQPSAPQKFGRYQLLGKLGRGGMAELFVARLGGRGGFTKVIAIKRMLPHLSDDPDFVKMFLDEGRIAARLTHPNICQVHELGEVDGQLFLAMEYLEGLTWEDLVPLIPRGKGYELRLVAGVLGQACDGLHYAHTLRDAEQKPTPVVHRDVSPQNLFVTTDGVCKVLDFGVSKILTENSRTRTGMLKGKLPYMAPEQIRGERLDARADVFATGVLLWEGLTGEPLFLRDNDYQIWRAITEGPVPPVTSKVPDLPREIDAVITRALERDPEQRYASIRLLAQDLRYVASLAGGALDAATIGEALQALAGEQLAERARHNAIAIGNAEALRQTGPAPVVPAAADRSRNSVYDESRIVDRRSRWPFAIVGFALIATLGIVVWAKTGAKDPAPAQLAVADEVADAALIAPADAATVAIAPPVDAEVEIEFELEDVTDDAAVAPVGAVPEVAVEVRVGGTGSTRPPRKPDRSDKPDRPDKDNRDKPGKPGAGSGSGSSPSVASDPTKPGFYSVDSKPYATIYIDGTSHGDTPLFRISLPPGKHTVKAVRADGTTKTFTITIESGTIKSSGQLRW
jgi:hypothetical protein